MNQHEMTVAKHPDATKAPTRMRKDRYDLVREALLNVIPAPGDPEGIPFGDLAKAVAADLEKRTGTSALPDGGSIMWNVTTVKLDLEARGLIERLATKGPQRVRKTRKGTTAGA